MCGLGGGGGIKNVFVFENGAKEQTPQVAIAHLSFSR